MQLCRTMRGVLFATAAVMGLGGLVGGHGLRPTALPLLQVAGGLVAHWPLNSAATPQNDVGGTHPITLVGGPIATLSLIHI